MQQSPPVVCVRLFHQIFHLRVPLHEGKRWMWIATETFRLFQLRLNNNEEKMKYSGLKVHSLLTTNQQLIDLNKLILVTDLQQVFAMTLILQMIGPIVTHLNAQLLQYISDYLNNQDINSMMRCCKQFHYLLSNDKIWESPHRSLFNSCKWQGIGWKGSESKEWNMIRDDAGLTIVNINRMRWMAHNTSRLKLFYGGLQIIHEPWYHINFRNIYDEEMIQSFILLISNHQKNIMNMMRLLHFIVPESSTSYHHSTSCKPLTSNIFLMNIESSPKSCRSRNHHKDPGTRVECSKDQNITLRRIGDRRLTFIGIETNVLSRHESCNCLSTVLEKVTCSIIVAEYDNFDPKITYRAIAEAWREVRKDRVILIFIKIHWKEWAPIDGSSDYCTLPAFRIGIQHVVNEVANMITALIHADTKRMRDYRSIYKTCSYAGYRSPSWYVQPMDGEADEDDLNSGFFTGINWLLRNISSKRE